MAHTDKQPREIITFMGEQWEVVGSYQSPPEEVAELRRLYGNYLRTGRLFPPSDD